MDNAEARQWLDSEWEAALASDLSETDDIVDFLANSSVVAIRYALVTQLLGKIADPSRNLFVLQQSDEDEGAWDARSFSTAVVVPWVADNQSVLGTSAEPYASKPLRRQRLVRDMPDVRSQHAWNELVTYFEAVEGLDHEGLVDAFRRVLRSLARRLAEQTFEYPVPARASLPQLERLIASFLDEASGGLRPLVVATALLHTFGKAFSIFSRVESQGVNEADAASGMPGDIVCFTDDNAVALVVEVKDMALTIGHVRASSLKAKSSQANLSSLLFAVPGVREQDRGEIDALASRDWAAGLNIYTVDIQTLCSTTFVLLDEKWRVTLVREVGKELDKRQDQTARKAWHDLLIMESSS